MRKYLLTAPPYPEAELIAARRWFYTLPNDKQWPLIKAMKQIEVFMDGVHVLIAAYRLDTRTRANSIERPG